MKARTWPRTASSSGSNQSAPRSLSSGVGADGVAWSRAWVPQQGFGTYATFQIFHHFRDTTMISDFFRFRPERHHRAQQLRRSMTVNPVSPLTWRSPIDMVVSFQHLSDAHRFGRRLV
jgi:hypothetical protein